MTTNAVIHNDDDSHNIFKCGNQDDEATNFPSISLLPTSVGAYLEESRE